MQEVSSGGKEAVLMPRKDVRRGDCHGWVSQRDERLAFLMLAAFAVVLAAVI